MPRRILKDGLRGLEVVDTAIGLIEGAVQKEAEFFAGAEALAKGSVKPASSVTILNGIVSSRASQGISRPFPGGPSHQIDRAADAIGVLAGGKRLEHFDALDQIGGDGARLDMCE